MRPIIALVSLLIAAPVWASEHIGYAECGDLIEIPYPNIENMGFWHTELVPMKKSFSSDTTINQQDPDVSLENRERAINEGVYIFPCAILYDEEKWDAYWPKWRAYVRKRKREAIESNRKHEKYMDCMYRHRKEMNEQNRQFIQHKCYKEAYG